MQTVEQKTSLRAAYWAYLKAMDSEEAEGERARWRALQLYRDALRSQRAGARLARVSPSRRANLKDVRRRWKRLERRHVAPGVVVVPFDRLHKIARTEETELE